MLSASAQSIDIYSVTKKLDINKMLCMVTQNISANPTAQATLTNIHTRFHSTAQRKSEKTKVNSASIFNVNILCSDRKSCE